MSSIDAHKKAYKPRATVEEGRHKRQQENLAIRKQKREEHIAKRRQITVVEDDHKEEYNRIVAQVWSRLRWPCHVGSDGAHIRRYRCRCRCRC